MRADGEDYSVFRQEKVPPSGMYSDVTPQEADEIRAAFREESRSRLRIPRIAIPRGPDGFIHTSVMSALDAQDSPQEVSPGRANNNNRNRWSWSRILGFPLMIRRLQRVSG